jgi:hypothetical protein
MIGRTDPRIARLGIARLQAAFDAGIGRFCLGGGKFDFVIPGGAWIARIAGATGAARIGRCTRVGCRAGVARAARATCCGTRIIGTAGIGCSAGVGRSTGIRCSTGVSGCARITRITGGNNNLPAATNPRGARNRGWIFSLVGPKRGLNFAPHRNAHTDDDRNESARK